MNFSGANVLITGGAGFIGSNLAHTLVRMQANVTLVDSFIPEYGGNLENIADIRNKVTLNIADVRDPHAMRYLVQGQDYLFNLAGQTSHMDSMTDPFTDLEINSRAQLFILESCRQHNPGIKIVFAGTRQIYGKPDYLPVDELHPIRPVDINGIHKLAGEWYHLLYNTVYDIHSTVLRLTNTYGPHMRIKDARQTFVGIWLRRLLEGQPFEVWGGDQLRDFTYVDDCVAALLAAATSPNARGKVYNIGGDKVVSLKELADILIAVHGSGSYHLKEFPADRKKIDIGDYYSQDTLIRQELGWAPQVPLETGLATTLQYFQNRMEAYL